MKVVQFDFDVYTWTYKYLNFYILKLILLILTI